MIPHVETAMFAELNESLSEKVTEQITAIGAKHRVLVSEMGW